MKLDSNKSSKKVLIQKKGFPKSCEIKNKEMYRGGFYLLNLSAMETKVEVLPMVLGCLSFLFFMRKSLIITQAQQREMPSDG